MKANARFTKLELVEMDAYPYYLLSDNLIYERYKEISLDKEIDMVVLKLFAIPLLKDKYQVGTNHKHKKAAICTTHSTLDPPFATMYDALAEDIEKEFGL